MIWTPDKIEKLFQLRSEGQTFERIGFELGCGRNAVIGKYNRVRVQRGEHQVTPRKRLLSIVPVERKAPPRRDTVEKVFGRQPKLPTLPETGIGAILPTITKPFEWRSRGRECGITNVTGCRWPVGHDASVVGGHLFCNDDQVEGSSYCPCHRQESTASYSRVLIKKTIKGVIAAFKMKSAA